MKFSMLKNIILGVFFYSISAFGSEPDLLDDQKTPCLYAVLQQMGRQCPFISWVNLEKVRSMRERGNGQIEFSDTDYLTKAQSYALFTPCMVVYDAAYGSLRKDGPYCEYEQMLRSEGIKSTERFGHSGEQVGEMGLSPLEKSCRENYTPYNIKVSPYESALWIPLFYNEKTDQAYVYTGIANEAVPLPKIPPAKFRQETDIRLSTSHGEVSFRAPDGFWEKFCAGSSSQKIFLSSMLFPGVHSCVLLKDEIYDREYFYLVGTYQHLLFACGVNAQNTEILPEDRDYAAFRELDTHLKESLLNPWARLNKADLFEYHLANIFIRNSHLKEKALQSVGFFTNVWKIYKDSFALYDRPDDSKKMLSERQKFMPGEEQMLAYYFSSQLRLVWAACVNKESLIAITELEDKLGDAASDILIEFLVDGFLQAAQAKSYGEQPNTYSFLDVWSEIKENLFSILEKQKDLVTFPGHGCVISFDEKLLQLQPFANREMANLLGFVYWESLYDKALHPFYRKSGGKAIKWAAL